LSLLACVLACASTEPTTCPQPQACPACPQPGPYAQLPAPDLVPPPEPSEEPDPQGARQVYNNLSIYVRVEDRERDIPDATPIVRVEVRHTDTDELDTLERPADFGACLIQAVHPEIDVLFGDEEILVLDAKYACVFGEDVRHLVVQHLVLQLDYTAPGMRTLYAGTSEVHDAHRVVVSVDKREFYVEAGQLAVYRHTVDWCDAASLATAHGDTASCKQSPRKLKLLQRIPLRP
jgi:hypothetical protein